MLVALADKSKQSMIFLGGDLNFTYDSPGPVAVEIEQLTESQLNQLFYNWRRGILTVDDIKSLQKACGETPAATTNFTTPNEQPIRTTKPIRPPEESKSILDQVAAQRAKLVRLLRETIPTIKSKLGELTPSEIRILIEAEESLKKRKSLLEVMNSHLNLHEAKVLQQVGEIDVGTQVHATGFGITKLDSSFTIEESDMIDIVLIPPDNELGDFNG